MAVTSTEFHPASSPSYANAAGTLSDADPTRAGSPLVLRLQRLSDPALVKALLLETRHQLSTRGHTVLILDGSEMSGAVFDSVWELELLAMHLPGTVQEWRHVPCWSPALMTALRRILRVLQSRGVVCGVFNSYADAVAELDEPQDQDTGLGLHGRAGQARMDQGRLLIELAAPAPEFDLALLVDSVTQWVPQHTTHTAHVVVRLLQGTGYPPEFFRKQVERIQQCGSGAIVIVADESGLPGREAYIEQGLHVTSDYEEAVAQMNIIGMQFLHMKGPSQPVDRLVDFPEP